MSEAATIIRAARPDDAEAIVRLIDALNATEGDPPTTLTRSDIEHFSFGPDAWFTTFIAEHASRPVGFATATRSFHPQRGGPGFHLIDLFVEAELRGQGLGRALFRAVAQHCRDEGGRWLDWHVWIENAKAYAFYEALGARHNRQASLMVLDGDAFADALSEPQRSVKG